jgi:hypothetical protein
MISFTYCKIFIRKWSSALRFISEKSSIIRVFGNSSLLPFKNGTADFPHSTKTALSSSLHQVIGDRKLRPNFHLPSQNSACLLSQVQLREPDYFCEQYIYGVAVVAACSQVPRSGEKEPCFQREHQLSSHACHVARSVCQRRCRSRFSGKFTWVRKACLNANIHRRGNLC